MRPVLFDLGQTLENAGELMPGALEVLEAIRAMRGESGRRAVLGLVSDYTAAATPAQVPHLQAEYYEILDHLGIRPYFEPVGERVTLSTEVGVRKPDERIFRAALDKIAPDQRFASAMFVTENGSHVAAARALGLHAVHFTAPGQPTADVTRLVDLIPLVQSFLDGQ